MDIFSWIPPIATTSLFALVIWLGRNLITTRLVKSVEHEFNINLESVRAEIEKNVEILKADLRQKEAEIASLREGAMAALANRHIALDKRRLEAVDHIWSTIVELGPARSISNIMSVVNFDRAAERAEREANIRKMFGMLANGFDFQKIDMTISSKARPFVSPMAWALFSAYVTITLHAVMRFKVIESGIGALDFINQESMKELVKTALPDRSDHIDRLGERGYHTLLYEIENALLNEFQNMMSGVETSKAIIAQAAEINKHCDLIRTSIQANLPPNCENA